MGNSEARAACIVARLPLPGPACPPARAMIAAALRRAQAEVLRQAANELHLNISGRQGLRDLADALDAEEAR